MCTKFVVIYIADIYFFNYIYETIILYIHVTYASIFILQQKL